MQVLMRAYSEHGDAGLYYAVIAINKAFKAKLAVRQGMAINLAADDAMLSTIAFVDDYNCRYFNEVPIHLTEEQKANLDCGEVIVFVDDIALDEKFGERVNFCKMHVSVAGFKYSAWASHTPITIYTKRFVWGQVELLETDLERAIEEGTNVV